MPPNGFDYPPPQQHLMAMKLAIAEAAVKMKSKMGWVKEGKSQPDADVLGGWREGEGQVGRGFVLYLPNEG